MYDKMTRLHAKSLFRQGWKIMEIAAEMAVAEKTVRLWRDRENWAVQLAPEEALEARIVHLVNRANKDEAEYWELERLIDALNRLERGKTRKTLSLANGDNGLSSGNGQAPTGRKPRKPREVKNEIGGLRLDHRFLKSVISSRGVTVASVNAPACSALHTSRLSNPGFS